MNSADLLADAFGRIREEVHGAVADLTSDELSERPDHGSNSIGWLLWHLIRVQDHHISELLESPQIWVEGDWASQFGLAPDAHNTGYGHSAGEVATVRPHNGSVLTGYLDAVSARVRDLLERVSATDLDRVVDRRWDPPVTMGVRLVSVAGDCLQHAGQAAYVRGLLEA